MISVMTYHNIAHIPRGERAQMFGRPWAVQKQILPCRGLQEETRSKPTSPHRVFSRLLDGAFFCERGGGVMQLGLGC